MELNFFLIITQICIFLTFYSIYLSTMYANKELWKGIEENKLYLLACDAFYFTISTHTSLGYGDIITYDYCIYFLFFHLLSPVYIFIFKKLIFIFLNLI